MVISTKDKELLASKNSVAGIYCITSPSNKKYVGQSWDIRKRIRVYDSVSCNEQPYIYSSLCKYGSANHFFEIKVLYLGDDQADLNRLENDIWRLYRDNFEMLNVMEPKGQYGKHNEESKRKISSARMGKGNGMFGRPAWNRGMPMSDESKAKMTKQLIGRPAWNKGIPMSEDQKKALRTSWDERNMSNESKQRAKKGLEVGRQWRKGTGKLCAKTVSDIITRLEAGQTQAEIAKDLKVSQSYISMIKKGKRLS